jgi:hypothetical protein
MENKGPYKEAVLHQIGRGDQWPRPPNTSNIDLIYYCLPHHFWKFPVLAVGHLAKYNGCFTFMFNSYTVLRTSHYASLIVAQKIDLV